ncbi:MAG: hypothetical protein R2819_15600 [Allomuricauda sp.]
MKTIYHVAVCFLLIFYGCKSETKKAEKEPEKSIPELVANAHGYPNWKSVKQITFTFNVERDTVHYERSWVWKPKANEVMLISAEDTLTYNRKSMDSIAFKANAGFINDKYWLLAPFNLIWDSGNYTFEHSTGQKAPISGETMQKLTIVYANDGGYTPGDAYDFYFKDDFILREWVYRKSNQAEPSMTTTWEDYKDIDGLLLAQDHRKANEDFSLHFTNLSILKD